MGCWIITCLWGCIGFIRARMQIRRQKRQGKEVERMLEGQEIGVVEVDWDDGDGEDEKGLIGEKRGKRKMQEKAGQGEESEKDLVGEVV
jgi:hypothetical protein